MQGTPSSHIENLGLHGPHYAQKIAEKGLSDLCQSGDSSSPVGKAESDSCADSPEVKAQQFVGLDAEKLSDEEREMAAYRAGVAMQTWYGRYQQTGDTRCVTMAHHFLGIQKTLLAGRSAEYVAKLEAERGLD